MSYPKNAMDAIRSAGHRVTRQRQVVLDILDQNQGHLDAEALYERARARDENIGIATIYRTLVLLKKIGVVKEEFLGQHHGQFEKTPPLPHYHFTCLKCGRVIEFEAPQLTEIAHQLSKNKKIQVSEITMHLSGLCSQCIDKKMEN
jgi:Fe2+ or Zn2+ uptake regulation protein